MTQTQLGAGADEKELTKKRCHVSCVGKCGGERDAVCLSSGQGGVLDVVESG